MTEVKLKDIAEIFSGVHIFRFMDETADLKPVLKNKLDENNNLEFDYENISDKIDLKYYSKKGDILISLSEPNTVYKLNHEGFIITMYFVIIRLKDNYDSSFIFHILESNSCHKKLYKLLEGGALKVIKVADLKNLTMELPSYEKQKQYGALLDLIDKKIELKEKSIKKDNDYKESIIEHIFKN